MNLNDLLVKENFELNYDENKFNCLKNYLFDSKETFRVLYNDCYGGFIYSDEVKNIIKKEFNPVLIYEDKFRLDPFVLDLYDKLGDKFGSPGTEIKVDDVPIYFKSHFSIHEYDGMESIKYRFSDLKLYLISFVNQSNMTFEQKSNLIQMILDKEYKNYY